MVLHSLGAEIEDIRIFKGAQIQPLLAPRGVFVVNNKLFMTDTGQNRAFIWNCIPNNEYKNPDIIIGQQEVQHIGRNSKVHVSAKTLHYPSGIWSNGNSLVIADAWNHRVLIWHTLPSQNAQEADVVVGQKDFYSNLPNESGVGKNPSARSLYWPYGVFSDGKSLWIADTGNRRVLYYKNIPKENHTTADQVIGQNQFTTRDLNSKYPVWPYSVRVNKQGNLAITDTQYFRVMIWNHKDTAFKQKADVIIGQEDFQQSGQNQFLLHPKSNTLNWVYDSCFYKEGILINDTGNSRILFFDQIPTFNNGLANAVIGRPDFQTGSDFSGNQAGTQTSIYWPFSICIHQDVLYIADTGNHRLVIGKLKA